jgi:hypothetical protein
MKSGQSDHNWMMLLIRTTGVLSTGTTDILWILFTVNIYPGFFLSDKDDLLC